MKVTDPIDDFLRRVEAHLPRGDGARRRRYLEEIQGHLSDSIARLITDGADPVDAAHLAIRDFGSPEVVAGGMFDSGAERRDGRPDGRTGRRFRWAPIALPVALATLALVGAVYFGYHGFLRGGTRGEQAAFRTYVQSVVLFASLSAVGAMLLRREDGHRRFTAAWLVTAAAVVVLVL